MSSPTLTPKASRETNPYLAQFDAFEKTGPARLAPWLLALRKAGISHFAELGFPTLQHEEWCFTNVAPIAKLKPVFEVPAAALAPEDVRPFTFASLEAHRLVFVNGHYAPALSSLGTELSGLQVSPLAAALAADAPGLKTQLARHARSNDSAFVALNTALFRDGACVMIPADRTLTQPILLLFLTTGLDAGAQIFPRVFIHAGARSRASVIESHASLGEGVYVNNVVTEIVVEEEAVLDHCKLQDESQSAFHIATIQASLAARSHFTNHSISSGARLTRNNINLVMAGENVECILNGLYLGRGEQLIDHHTVADHARAHCNSHEFYHGVLDGRSRGVFNGKIFVRKDAQKTDAKQTNRNLLLSDDATVNTKPQLEIFADDVKCTHGATVGQLDEEAIFYLQSRGIGREAAREMLVHAFASDVINRIQQEPVREQLERLLARRLDRPHGRDA